MSKKRAGPGRPQKYDEADLKTAGLPASASRRARIAAFLAARARRFLDDSTSRVPQWALQRTGRGSHVVLAELGRIESRVDFDLAVRALERAGPASAMIAVAVVRNVRLHRSNVRTDPRGLEKRILRTIVDYRALHPGFSVTEVQLSLRRVSDYVDRRLRTAKALRAPVR